MKRALLVVALVALALAGVARAFTERADLEAKLPKQHQVFCSTSYNEWDSLGGFGAVGFTYISGPLAWTIWLSPDTCKTLGNPLSSKFPDAVETLYHEWFHAQFGLRNEGQAECLSLYILRYELRHNWGFTNAQAQRAYWRAVKAHIELGKAFPQYRGTCTFPQPDLVQ